MELSMLVEAWADMRKMDQEGGRSLREHRVLLVATRHGPSPPRIAEKKFGTEGTRDRRQWFPPRSGLEGVHHAQCGMK